MSTPYKPNMHSIHREEDDTRTMSPEMDAWRQQQIAKQLEKAHGESEEILREIDKMH